MRKAEQQKLLRLIDNLAEVCDQGILGHRMGRPEWPILVVEMNDNVRRRLAEARRIIEQQEVQDG